MATMPGLFKQLSPDLLETALVFSFSVSKKALKNGMLPRRTLDEHSGAGNFLEAI